MRNGLFSFQARVWLYPGAGGWHFLTLPPGMSGQIRKNFSPVKTAWGALPVSVKIGKTEWATSIFPDKKTNSYLLPIKADVRKKENIAKNTNIAARLKILRPEFRKK